MHLGHAMFGGPQIILIQFFYVVSIFSSSGEYYLGYKKFDLQGVSWYSLLHPECMKEVQSKHRQSKYCTSYKYAKLGCMYRKAFLFTLTVNEN